MLTRRRKNLNSIFYILPVAFGLLFFSCNTVDLYEKAASIPGHSWKNSFKPSFAFAIKDTTALYRVYFIIRHTDKYSFNNIYINMHTKQPGTDTLQTARFDCELATNDKGWLGAGMDDIYEHRVELTPKQGLPFKGKGDYTFTIEQIMRQDPLEHVLNAGIRIEKIKP